jgi:hypothetical protein
LTATDGFMPVDRSKLEKFAWGMLKWKQVLGFRSGTSSPR